MCGHNAEFLKFKLGGTESNYWTSHGSVLKTACLCELSLQLKYRFI